MNLRFVTRKGPKIIFSTHSNPNSTLWIIFVPSFIFSSSK